MNPSSVQKSVSITTGSGEVVNVQDLSVPEDLKEFLTKLDFKGEGQAGTTELHGALDVLKLVQEKLHGVHSDEEVREGIVALEQLMIAKKENHGTLNYRHMPERIQKILGQWDEMGHGFIDEADLLHAADCVSKVAKQNRMMRFLIVGLFVVIGILLGGMFGLSIAAAELSKEVRVEVGGVMRTPAGDVVKMENAEFLVNEGGILGMRAPASCAPTDSACERRLQTGLGSTLKISAAMESSQLISTLPDETWHQLLSVTLKMSNNTLKLMINDWNRVSARTSACGSVVHLHTQHGKLTVDDLTVSTDRSLSEHIHAMGFGSLLTNRRLTSFGHRQLRETDSMLVGFFNYLEGANYNCISQPLEAPEDLQQGYIAEISVRQIAERRADLLSKLHVDDEGNPIPMPGAVRASYGSEPNEIFKTWSEKTMVMNNGVEAVLSTYATFPFLRELRVKKGNAELRMVVDGDTGHRCEVTNQTSAGSISGSEDEGNDQRMEFVGIVEEGGLVLRHFRLHIADYVAAQKRGRRLRRLQDNESRASSGELPFDAEMLIMGGVIPTHMDYFDVDSDPSGVFQPGDTYRITSYSTIRSARLYSEKTYHSVAPHPENLSLPDVFAAMGVVFLGHNCTWVGAETSDMADLTEAAQTLPIATTGDKPPSMELPFSESADLVTSYERLVAVESALLEGLDITELDSEALDLARSTDYWSMVLMHDTTTEQSNFENLATPDVENSSGLEEDQEELTQSGSRRLDEEPTEEPSGSQVPIFLGEPWTTRSGNASSELQDVRSLSGRRLGFEVSFTHWEDGGVLQSDLSVEFNVLSIAAVWARDVASQSLVMLKGEGKGCVTVWRPPEVKVCAGGAIEFYTNPFAIGGSLILEIEVSIKIFKIMIGLEIGGKLWFPRRGGGDSSTLVNIRRSSSNRRCINAGARLSCASNAGDRGIRTNSDWKTAGDTFEITTSGSTVCARRLDYSGGWGMNLQIKCTAPALPSVAVENLWGKIYTEVGRKRVGFYAEVKGFLEPGVDCEGWCSTYYKKWKLTVYVTFGVRIFKYSNRWTVPILEKNIGRR